MKFFIVFACALAVASAGHIVAPVAPIYGAQHLPVIGPNGVPVDTPAVQHATAAHLAHKVEAHVRNGDYAAPVIAPVVAPAFGVVGTPAAYPTHLGVPAVTSSGVPLDTPEVAAAKINHFAAHGEALARTGYAGVHYLHKRGIYAPVAAYHTTPYVATTYAFPAHHLYRRGIYAPVAAYSAYHGAYSYPTHHAIYRRGIVAPVAYSGYAHTAYSGYPYAHYY